MSSATRKCNLFKILSDHFRISWVFFTDLPIIKSAIISTLRKFEGCLGVEGWLKSGNKGHYFQAWFSLEVSANFFSSFVDQRLGWGPFYQGCHHEETSDFGSESDPTLTQHCATFSPVTPIFYCISAVYMSQRTFCLKFEKNLSDISTTPTLP